MTEIELHALAEETLEQQREIGQRLADIHHFRPQGLAAGEGQQLAHQGCRPVRILLDLHDVLEGMVRRPVAGEQQVRVADDRLKDVVEVVRDAAGELAHRVHLLGLGDLLFELALSGRVEGVEDHPLPVAVASGLAALGVLTLRSVGIRRAHPDAGRAIAGTGQADLDRFETAEPVGGTGQRPLHGAAVALEHGVAHHRVGCVAAGLRRRLARHPGEQAHERGVGADHAAVAVEGGDGDRAVVEEARQSHLRRPLRLVGIRAGGAVEHEGARRAGRPVLPIGDAVVEPGRQRLTVPTAQIDVVAVGAHLAGQTGRGGEHVGAGRDFQELQAAGADGGEVVAEPGGERRIHVDDRAGGIDRQEAGRRMIEIVDRVLEFLEDVFLALTLVGDVAHRPEGGGPAMALDRPHRDAVPGEVAIRRAARRRRHPDLFRVGAIVARGLRKPVDRLRYLRGPDENPLDGAQVRKAVAAGQPHIGFVGVDHPAIVFDDELALGRGVDDGAGDVVARGRAGELQRADGQGEQEEHARHREQRQQSEDERLRLLVGDEGQPDRGADEQPRQHQQQADPTGPFRTIDRTGRRHRWSADLSHQALPIPRTWPPHRALWIVKRRASCRSIAGQWCINRGA